MPEAPSEAPPQPPAAPGDAGDDLLWRPSPGGVAWLTLNRPHAGNAVTGDQRDRVIALLAAASGDPRVRAIVITGAGDRHFCTGADLAAATRPGAAGAAGAPDGGPPEGMPERPAGTVARAVAKGAQRLVCAIQDCEKPVIAAVNGTAAGIGCHLAYACDLVLAADTARFIEVFARRGLVVDGGGAYLLARLVGPQRAKELIFFGDDLPAAEAHRLGLVNRVVPAAELAATAADWAARLAAGPTVALGLGKRLVNRALDGDRATALAEEAMAAEINMTSEDGREGLRAFAERRKPRFQGW
ncbi:enoyl-CoA hydratase/isomerase family protein [Actinomadura fibrosa]|uniref:Enoyl-CoA hydratase/isomerase family protein n=1 Tax=Actinomadura fibrosa TaxID=111802 RepID=A0ABW2XWI1_9ACTN|nr:enoyl-CoA hydratase-related protein [Actinomadura fibrosa]